MGNPDMAMDWAGLADGPARRNGRAIDIGLCDVRNKAVALMVPKLTAVKPERQRVRSRAARGVFASRKARLDFLDALTRCGDPAVAAAEMDLSLVRLFRLRAEDADFAAQWHAAIGYAWERVEHRVLADLLKPGGGIDSKVALAVIARRDQGAAKVKGRSVDSAAVARLRAELRALAEPHAVRD